MRHQSANIHRVAKLDAQQGRERLRIGLIDAMTVVGRDERDTELSRDRDRRRPTFGGLGQRVVHDLDIVIVTEP
jgi:hypothetical protein